MCSKGNIEIQKVVIGLVRHHRNPSVSIPGNCERLRRPIIARPWHQIIEIDLQRTGNRQQLADTALPLKCLDRRNDGRLDPGRRR
jgi:hypothetical protein